MSTSSGSIVMHGPEGSRQRRHAITAVVIAVAFGTGIFVGRASDLGERRISGPQIETNFPTANELRGPAATLHRRIYAHFPDLTATMGLEGLSDPIAALHRRIYAHFPEI